MEKIAREYKYDSSCYRYGAKPRADSMRFYYTEYVEYSVAGNPYFIRRWDYGLVEFDSEPLSAKGKQMFPNLTRYCPQCHEPLNLTKDHCTNPHCQWPIDDENRIRIRPKQVLKLLNSNKGRKENE